MEEGQRRQFLFLFLCSPVYFSLSEIPQLCSFSWYLLASHFPLLWADPVAKWLNHAICGTTVIFLSSSLWCQRPVRMTPWQAPAFSKCSGSGSSSGSDPKVQVSSHESQWVFCFWLLREWDQASDNLFIWVNKVLYSSAPLHCGSCVSGKHTLVFGRISKLMDEGSAADVI